MTTLSPQQQAIVDWIRSGSGSLNVIARAGCGKTFALVQGAVRTIVEDDLGEVALMAFNKAIADEIKEDVQALAAGDPRFGDWKRLQVGTCHSFGFAAWRQVAPGVKVDDKKVLPLIDERNRHGHAKMLNVFRDCSEALRAAVSLAKQSGCGALWSIEDRGQWFDLLEHHAVNDLADDYTLDDIVPAAIEVLRASLAMDREVIDFDDMILAPLAHKVRFWPKDWVLIDEAQDTNAARRALALAMLKPGGRLIAVGDDRQAIYGFTGADADALDLIASALGSKTLPLTVTYRCPKVVVAEANRLVPDLTAHPSAPEGVLRVLRGAIRAACRTCRGTGRVKGKELCHECKMTGVRLWPWFEYEPPDTTSVILCRNTKPLVEQAYTLLRAGIACRVAGREIGAGLIRLATRWKRVKTLGALAAKLEEHQDRETAKWLAKGREERAQAEEDRCQCLQALIRNLMAEHEDRVTALVAFIKELFGDDDEGRPALTLSTIHKAKGREWDTVYLLDRAGTLPSPWARKPWQLRQEENLEYVAVTRAKRELVDLIA